MVLWTASPVRAWTEANVRTVEAHVEVAPDGTALVAMELTVQVHGGWLEGIEITVPDPDPQLVTEKPPWAVSLDEPDHKFRVRWSIGHDGRLQLSFGRREAPRRGTIRVGLLYTTDLGHRATRPLYDGNVRIAWTLPGWRSGLDGVSVSVTAPPGSTRVEARDTDDDTVETEQIELSDRVVVRWQRAHLPRTVSWTVEVDVPETQVTPSLRAPRMERRHTSAPSVAVTTSPHGVLWTSSLALTLVLLCLVGGWTFHRECGRLGCQPRPLLPSPVALRVALTPIIGAAAVWACTISATLEPLVLLAVPALWLQRAPLLRTTPPMLGQWRPATRSDLRQARRQVWLRRLGSALPMDITTPVGVAVLGAVGLVLWEAATLIGQDLNAARLASAALVIVPFLNATRLQLPSCAAVRLDAARAVARRAPALPSPMALRLILHVAVDGRWQDGRLRIVPASPVEGLHALDLAFADRQILGGYERVPIVLAVSTRGSTADSALDGSLPEAETIRGPSSRVARAIVRSSVPWSLVARALDALAGEQGSGIALRAAAADCEAA